MQETRDVPWKMTVEINGSASQGQTSQQLMQNSIAEAASTTQYPTDATAGQVYNFPSQGPVYVSPLSNPGRHTGYVPTADYDSVHGAYCGYRGY